MKNAVILVGTWVGIILFAYAVALWHDSEVTQVALPGDTRVADDVGGFSFPLPVGWMTRPLDGGVAIDAPVFGIEAWALSVPATTADSALAAAWDLLDPCSSCERPAILESGALSDGRRGAFVTLGADANGDTGEAVVLTGAQTARVLLVRLAPSVSLPQRVSDDLARIMAGFERLEVPEPTAGVAPALSVISRV
jgi:hypothetical protein